MNTNSKAQQKTLTNTELARRIDDLINLNRLAGNSLSLDAVDPAADYALKEVDAKLADLLDYFSAEVIKEEVRDTPPPYEAYAELIDTGIDAHTKAGALLTAIVMCKDGEGFFTLKEDYAHAYVASIEAEVERMKTTIDGLEKLVRECC